MSNRKTPTKEVTVNILTKSRRRCVLCFGLSGDLREKKGQIAHLDQDSSNSAEENLVFLCLEHHDTYDSKTSQSKGYVLEEVKTYAKHLYLAIETGLNSNLDPDQRKNDDLITHDRENFQIVNEILPESHLLSFLSRLQSDDSYSSFGYAPIGNFCLYFREVGNYYLLPEIEMTTIQLVSSLEKLDNFITYNFFPFPDYQIGEDRRFCLYPDLNVDRKGNGSSKDMSTYFNFQKTLHELCGIVAENYKNYRLSVKKLLLC
jgi:hypothetical protein